MDRILTFIAVAIGFTVVFAMILLHVSQPEYVQEDGQRIPAQVATHQDLVHALDGLK